ncbi:MAG: PepSY domain-containing protein [Rhodocyclaceae bacterium]|nr:PepSY domain-containing protein [Rhodocyclaceae bacterium]
MKKLLALAVMLGISVSANAAITPQQAKNIALSSAGGGQVTDFDLERKKSGFYYEVEVKNNGVEYEFKIDVATGKILQRKVENKVKPGQPVQPVTPTPAPVVMISVQQAKQIALQAVGGGWVTDIELENKRSANPYYEVEVRDNLGREYDVKINATTGAVISVTPDSNPGTGTVMISVQQAKQIALQAVGGGWVTDIELENKRSANPYYDVEVRDNRGREYEVKINATTGAVISVKRD